MNEAIKIAKDIKDEVPVCALIVKNNVLISKAINKTEKVLDPTAHAEIVAIKKAAKALGNWRLKDCTLYVTLEPCPMCMGAILNSRISKLIFGAYDLNLGACGSAVNLASELNKKNQIDIMGGILELEASKLLKEFFSLKRK